eukprot:8065245-Alexandrium_andersonii.AAC.2
MPNQTEKPAVRAGKLAALHPPAAGGLEGARFPARERADNPRPTGGAERACPEASRRSLAGNGKLPTRRSWCAAARVLLASLSVTVRTGAGRPTPKTCLLYTSPSPRD